MCFIKHVVVRRPTRALVWRLRYLPVIASHVLRRLGRVGRNERGAERLTDLRESGSLEQDADLVIFLHRKHHREGGTTQCIIEKQRNGSTGSVNLTLDRDLTLFTDGGTDQQEEELSSAQAEKKARQSSFIRRAHAR